MKAVEIVVTSRKPYGENNGCTPKCSKCC